MSATAAVLDTYELLEQILLYLRISDTLSAQRVSRCWRSLIRRSQPIQENLFLSSRRAPLEPVERDKPGLWRPPEYDEACDPLPIFKTLCKPWLRPCRSCRAYNRPCLFAVTKRFLMDPFNPPDNADHPNCAVPYTAQDLASRDNMFVTAPPVTTVDVLLRPMMLGMFEGVEHPSCSVRVPTGVTFGDVRRAARSVAESHERVMGVRVSALGRWGFSLVDPRVPDGVEPKIRHGGKFGVECESCEWARRNMR